MYTAKDIKQILYFYSPNCNQCKESTKSLNILDNKFNVKYIDGDKNPKISRKYNIDFYPIAILLDKENNILDAPTGARCIQIIVNQLIE